MKTFLCTVFLLALAATFIDCRPEKKQTDCYVDTVEGSYLYNCTYGFAESSESACSCESLLQSYAFDCSEIEDNQFDKRQYFVTVNIYDFLNNLGCGGGNSDSASVVASSLFSALLVGLTAVLN
jgi:hypothetical protein